MADTTIVSSPAPRKRRRWLRVLAWLVGLFVLLLVVVYFVGTSSAVFKGVILPRLSKTINADVTVTDASISPFKQVVLHNFKVQSKGTEPLVTASEVRLRYSLMDIIGGNIHVDEATLSSPTIVLVENPDGSSNLDPIRNSQKEKPKPAKAEPSKPSKPLKIDVKKVAMTGGTIRSIKIYKDGQRDVTELSNVNLTLDDLKNGQAGKLAQSADIKIQATNGLLQAKLKGDFVITPATDSKSASLKGNTHLEVTSAQGAMSEFASLASDLDCDVTPTDVKQLALRFSKGNARLGELRASGPFDMAKTEGHLTVQALGIDKQVLNLAGAKSGIDFGSTTLSSTNDIQLAKAGSLITAAGHIDIGKFQVTRTNQTTPQLDLHAQYNVIVDRSSNHAVLHELDFTGVQKGTPLLRSELTSPMTIAWGGASNAVGDSTLNLIVTNFNFADWKPFLGDLASAGTLNGKVTLLSQQSGKQLTFDANSQIENLTAGSGSNQITQANVALQVRGQAADLERFNLSEYKLQVARQNQPLVTLSGSGTYDQKSGSADMQMTGQAFLARLLQAMQRPDVNVSSGTADLKIHLTQTPQASAGDSPRQNEAAAGQQSVTGNLALTDFTGRFGSNEFHGFGATMELDVNKTPQEIQIRKAAGKLTEGSNAGGSFDLSGNYNSAKKSGQLTAKLADFNQNGLRAFLEPMLADKKLVSISLNGNASAQYSLQGDSSFKADLQVTNLVVKDPKNQIPEKPLEAKVQMDTSIHKQVADVRQFQLSLTPTARATNQVQLTGHLDMTQTNATQGTIKLVADSLDLTSYYDLFHGEKKTTANAGSSTAPQTAATPSPPGSSRETPPATNHLPFRNFTADANIRRIYLHEMEVADMHATAKLDGGHMGLNLFKLSLNGAPVDTTVDLDLGVPGYKYDVAFNAKAVPLAPLVNSFQPERKGQVQGTLTAQGKLAGTGTSGASLKKTLAGQFDMSSTNLNLAVQNIKNPMLKALVEVIVIIPDLAQNPGGALGSLGKGVLGSSSGSGGASDDLKKITD